MNINPTLMTNVTNSASATSVGNSGNAGSEKNMFMTLLVAQLKNQDPLAPQDGAAFVAQLAQFNSLDQLIGIRQSIEALATKIQHGTTAPEDTKI